MRQDAPVKYDLSPCALLFMALCRCNYTIPLFLRLSVISNPPPKKYFLPAEVIQSTWQEGHKVKDGGLGVS